MEWLETIENGRRLRVYVRPGTDDARFVYEASGNADYQDARAFLSAGAVVIDVGGHIGAFALCAAANGARVITIKPVPDNFHRLTENIAANAMQSQVKAIRAALWSAAGERVMQSQTIARRATASGMTKRVRCKLPCLHCGLMS